MFKSAHKATFLASLGAGLEYYDFIIYGMMAGYLSQLFFASDLAWIALLKAFGVFAIGYLARPFGGIVFGMIGDTFGRKKTFQTVMVLMAISTFCIGLLPTYAQIGTTASCLLVLLRLVQGLSFGAELPGALTVVCEYAKKQNHGSYFGFVFSSVCLGSALASLVLFLLSSTIEQTQIMQWGWRIPFLLGGGLAIANYYIRKNLQETPEFLREQKDQPARSIKKPFHTLLQRYRIDLLLGIGMTTLIASLVIFALYMPTYLSVYFGYAPSDIYLATTWALLWLVLMMPVCGWIADRIGKVRVMVAASLFFGASILVFINLVNEGGLYSLIGFMLIYQTLQALLTVSCYPILVAHFPVEVRYTGFAICYNVTYSLMGGLPIVMTGLIEFTQMPLSAIFVLICCALLSAICVILLSKRSVAQSIVA